MNRRGIILAGGMGTRLHPVTIGICKQLLPVYDKPMIYYPLSTLMLAGVREILVVSTPEHIPQMERLLGDGNRWGIEVSYAVQERPEGIADALLVAEDYVAGRSMAVILGDNLFYGSGFTGILRRAAATTSGATVFAYRVSDSRPFGVVEYDGSGRPTGIVEKPDSSGSGWAVTGLYFFDSSAFEFARSAKPSARGELEISEINTQYLSRGTLTIERLPRGMAWLDTGSHDSLLDASHFIQTIERRQGLKVGCPEEVAWRSGWINNAELEELAGPFVPSGYGHYLLDLLREGPAKNT